MTATVKRIWKKSIALLLSFAIMMGTISDLSVSAYAEETETYGWEILESFDPNSEEYAQLKEMMTSVNFLGNANVQGNYMSNDYIALNVVGNGRFTIGTTGGNPNNPNDNNKKMLFGHPGGNTSYTTVRVDGVSYLFGDAVSERSTAGHIDILYGDGKGKTWFLDGCDPSRDSADAAAADFASVFRGRWHFDCRSRFRWDCGPGGPVHWIP